MGVTGAWLGSFSRHLLGAPTCSVRVGVCALLAAGVRGSCLNPQPSSWAVLAAAFLGFAELGVDRRSPLFVLV